MRSHFRWCASALALLLCVACGDDGDDDAVEHAGEDAGGDAPERTCCETPLAFPMELCVDEHCLKRCALDGDADVTRTACEPGHACVQAPGRESFVCSGECRDDLCPERSECDSRGSCFKPDQCGRSVPCLDATQICDVALDRCYPRNGDCSEVGCPRFSVDVRVLAEITCAEPELSCKAALRSAPLEWFSERTSGSIQITSPAPGRATVFEPGTDIEFAWEEQSAPVLLRVLDRSPRSGADYREGLVWGASVASGASHKLTWSRGYRRTENAWSKQRPAPPEPGLYYFAVIAVRHGEKQRVSGFVPFAVGEEYGFAEPGKVCQREGVPGDCISASQPLSCFRGKCRRICASHGDCEGERCGDPVDGRRLCDVEP